MAKSVVMQLRRLWHRFLRQDYLRETTSVAEEFHLQLINFNKAVFERPKIGEVEGSEEG